MNNIALGHGAGGKIMHQLISNIVTKGISNPILNRFDDSAVFENQGSSRLAFTTDSFVVSPLFFKGGDIGKLAVCGTVNDLAMSGATCKYLSLSFIIEEGFSIDELNKICTSIKECTEEAGVQIITGDTKVVEKGKGDGLFINTSGLGFIENDNLKISSHVVKAGDAIILSGYLGDHEMSILSARREYEIELDIASDVSPLNGVIKSLHKFEDKIHCLKDPTRGGLASALNEISYNSNINIEINEEQIPIRKETLGTCDLLGFDPLYLANEGKFICVCSQDIANEVLKELKKHPYGEHAAIIGNVIKTEDKPRVFLNTTFGGKRIVQMLSGVQLPRIC
ncbi:MAG: hydrogenase expression/formation protein HypE [Pseudomonadota bacterium]